MMFLFADVMSVDEAAERWNVSRHAVRQSCISRNGNPPRFQIGIEARRSGGVWLVTRAGMERLYGKESK